MKKFKIKNYKKRTGFTLIELLIVIAVLAILATVAFVALNPLARFQDARNSIRWTDVNAIISAIKLHQVDNQGAYYDDINDLVADTAYMIGGGDDPTVSYTCLNPTVALASECIDLSYYAEEEDTGYLPSVPIDPNSGSNGTDAEYTGYYLIRKSIGTITIGSCYEEQGSNSSVPNISVTR